MYEYPLGGEYEGRCGVASIFIEASSLKVRAFVFVFLVLYVFAATHDDGGVE